MAPPAKIVKRRSRAKQSIVWEEFENKFNGEYPEYIPNLAKLCPKLTPQELRVCTAIRAGKKTFEIANDLLFITEHRVEDHRYNIRKKLSVKGNLESYLKRF